MNTDLRTCSCTDLGLMFVLGVNVVIEGSLFRIVEVHRSTTDHIHPAPKFTLTVCDNRTGLNHHFSWQYQFKANIIKTLP